MPVYNTEQYVSDAIKSILNQTYTNFEFIIIDDGSSDNSPDIINKFKDSRIRFFQNHKNLGVSDTLNFGIKVSTGEFIARMDSDDISIQERFFTQYNHFKKENCLVLGSSLIPFKENKFLKKIKIEKNNLLAIIDPFFSHPTVMIKKNFLDFNNLNYSGISEDYYLWTKILKENNYSLYTFKNIETPLIYYRISDNQVTQTNKKLIDDDAVKIRRNALKDFFKFNNYDFEFSNDNYVSIQDLKNISRILTDLKNKDKRIELVEFEKKVIFYVLLSLDHKITFKVFLKEFSKTEHLQKLKLLNSFLFYKNYIKRF